MLRKSAFFFSVLLHPILMPLIGVTILMFSGSFISYIPVQSKKVIILLFVTGTILLPLFMFVLFWFKGISSSLHLENKNERIFAFSVTFIFYLFTYLLLRQIPVYQLLHSFMLGALISLFLLLLLCLRWKASAHMTGLGGLTAFIMVVSYKFQINLLVILILVFLAAGITATSRLILKAHNPSEIYTGYALGFFAMLGTLILQ